MYLSVLEERELSEMDKKGDVTIVNVGYRSTNYWVVSACTSRILVDIGWPGTMGQMKASLKRMGVPIDELRYTLATHYHIDHAGLAQEFKGAGVPLLVIDVQEESIPLMKAYTKPKDNYQEITQFDNITITCSESRMVLDDIGICGEIVHTPGHSDDSVSLLLDDGSAFTGDLTHPTLVVNEDREAVNESWRLLREMGATKVYPAHGPTRSIVIGFPV